MFKKRKRDIIDKIIEDNLDYLVRYAYYRLAARQVAEDIVYDAVLRFLEKKPNDIKPERVRFYLFKIVHNLCLDRNGDEKSNLIYIDGLEIEDKADDSLDLEEIDRINSCLESLPQREADIIRMNVIDNLSFVEISGILSIPQSTAKSRYKSGMEKLRKLYNDNKMS